MSVIEANIVIDAPDNMDITPLIALLESTISNINGKQTYLNIQEMDNAASLSPVHISKTRAYNDI